MRIVVYPHDLAVGGSQLNAIEIAATLHARGHESVLFGPPGPLVDRARALGLEFVEAPEPRRRPSPSVVRALGRLVDERGIQVVHGYEWPPILEAVLATRSRRGVAAVGTIMSMAVAPFLPRSIELVVGTAQIAAAERARGRRRVSVLEPPVDLRQNDPAADVGVAELRRRWGLTPDRLTVVSVARLARQLKLEGLLTAIDVVGRLSAQVPVRLLVVGDGPARAEVAAATAEANARYGAGTVVLTGELADPRPAYALADVALGMGGSALRSLAFATPLVVQGENGFWRLLTPQTEPEFRWTGWYGYGTDVAQGPGELEAILGGLLADPDRRKELGRFGRELVESSSGLDRAADLQLAVYERALSRAGGPSAPALVGSAAGYVSYKGRRRAALALGRGATDDFNARPVARSGSRGVVVYLSGVPWDAITGTDQHLVTALADRRDVLWVDPPVSAWQRRLRGLTTPPLSHVAPGVTRVHTVVPPGVSRPGVRTLSTFLVQLHARRVLAGRGAELAAVVASTPEATLRGWHGRVPTVYYATDDFVVGAELLGASVARARRARASNLRHADLVLACSVELLDGLGPAPGRGSGARRELLPNGCAAEHYAAAVAGPGLDVGLPRPVAGVVGQLNERLDLDLLEAVADTGTSLLLVGPRSERDRVLTERLDRLLARDTVVWLGRRPFDELPEILAAMDVGLTPYADTPFNRASHPLKTLEYLAAGLPVVSTDLPSARALATPHIRLASGSAEFSAAVLEVLAGENHSAEPRDAATAGPRDAPHGAPHAAPTAAPGDAPRDARRAFAADNSWRARAARLDELIREIR